MDKNELNEWIEQRLAHLHANACEPNTERAFARLRSRIPDLSSRAQRGICSPPLLSNPRIERRVPHVRKQFWLIGAALAAAACVCLLLFPTSRDAVQRLFVKSSNSKLVYVGQVYADLKTMKNKQPETDFTLKDAQGRDVTLSNLKGKVVLLNFWATWCEGCRTEIPWLVEFEQKYRDKGLAVVGVSEDSDGWNFVNPYLKSAGVNYPVVVDDGTVANRYSLMNMPATYLIDRDGKVSAASVGIIDKAECEAEILRLLGN